MAGRSGGVEDAVAETIVRLLRDDALRRQLGAQGQARVREEFDRRRQAARLWESCG